MTKFAMALIAVTFGGIATPAMAQVTVNGTSTDARIDISAATPNGSSARSASDHDDGVSPFYGTSSSVALVASTPGFEAVTVGSIQSSLLVGDGGSGGFRYNYSALGNSTNTLASFASFADASASFSFDLSQAATIQFRYVATNSPEASFNITGFDGVGYTLNANNTFQSITLNPGSYSGSFNVSPVTAYVGTGFRYDGQGGLSFDFLPAVAGVPEPATWALMIVGFGAAGGAMRRRANVRTRVNFA